MRRLDYTTARYLIRYLFSINYHLPAGARFFRRRSVWFATRQYPINIHHHLYAHPSVLRERPVDHVFKNSTLPGKLQ